MNDIFLQEQNDYKIDWYFLSKNSNDRALNLLEQNQNKIDCYCLSKNSNNRDLTLLDIKYVGIVYQKIQMIEL
jgi:hypothetical protein